MISKLSNRIVEAQINSKTISSEDRAIYQYGYILAIETFMNILVGIFIGVFFKSFDTVVVFWSVYIPLRSFCGGWHANKSWQCLIISNLVLIIDIKLETIIMDGADYKLIIGLCILFAFFIIFMSPVDTESKRLLPDEKKRYKRICMIIIVVQMIFGLLIRKVQVLIIISYVILFVSLLAQKIINCKVSHDI